LLPSLRRGREAWEVLLDSLARWYTHGGAVDWAALDQGRSRCRLALPTYPFQRQRFWAEEPKPVAATGPNHPVLGRALGTMRPGWEIELSLPQLPHLCNHQVRGLTIYPAAGFVQLALAAGGNAYGSSAPWSLKGLTITEALVLAKEQARNLQILLGPLENDACDFEIASRALGATDPWTVHARGRLYRSNLPSAASKDGEALQGPFAESLAADDLYALLERAGLQYGAAFQTIRRLSRRPGEALAEIHSTTATAYDLATQLDGCFQTLFFAIPGVPASSYVPVEIEDFQILGPLPPDLLCHAVLTRHNREIVEGELRGFNADRVLVFQVRGLRCRRWADGQQQPAGGCLATLYESCWQEKHVAFPRPAALLPSFAGLERWQAETTEIEAVERCQHRIDALALGYISRSLRQLGWDPGRDDGLDGVALTQKLGADAKHHRYLELLVRHVRAGKVVAEDPEQLLEALRRELPFYQPELTLIQRVGGELVRILRDPALALQVLFQDDTLQSWYVNSVSYRLYLGMLEDCIDLALKSVSAQRVFRILEVGAGTGALTSCILPRLPAGRVEFVFTDISSSFFPNARSRFAAYPFVKYRTLNLDRDLTDQGFSPSAFDLILADDVLHATRDLAHTLPALRSLLCPGGWLVFLEVTRCPIWADLLFGCLDGWWAFEDRTTRPHHATLGRTAWEQALLRSGFESTATLSNRSENEFFHTVFLAQNSAAPEERPRPEPGHWLVLADSQGPGAEVARALERSGRRVTQASSGADYRCLSTSHYRVCPAQPDQLKRLLATCGAVSDVAFLWSLDDPQQALIGLVHLVQSLCVKGDRPPQMQGDSPLLRTGSQALQPESGPARPRLWIITRDGQMEAADPWQALLVGLGRTIATEYPELNCTLVDVAADADANAIAEALRFDPAEPEYAYRQRHFYVPRLVPTEDAEPARTGSPGGADAFRLETHQAGLLDGLKFCATQRRPPGPGQVEIKVAAAGLNFLDVISALGMLPLDNPCPPLGSECAGTVVGVGPGVEEFKAGDEVIASGRHCFGTFVTTPADLVIHKPARLSPLDAAGIPDAFLTAYYALHQLAHMCEGEKVLIHSAAGGVGQAAVQLARLAGAELYATAGTPEKRDFLKSQGIAHVMNSRTLDWADEVLARSNGRGVDIVLNSLAGEAIPRGLFVLAPYGRFVEIGVRDIVNNSRIGLAPFRRDLAFFSVDLGRAVVDRSGLIKSLLRKLGELFEQGRLRPLPPNVYPFSRAVDAFRYMSRGIHIGKIVLDFEAPAAVPLAASYELFRPDATYLLTGGCGGFGLELARWMIRKGARHLVLLGRSGAATPYASRIIEELKQEAATVLVVRADVAREQDVQGVLTQMVAQGLPPLRGVFHLAMVLDDAPLSQMDPARLHKVLDPKVLGAWNLHQLTRESSLDYFVLFSSLASLVGSAQQANYSAAGAFLDALAHDRRRRQLPAVSINWGPLGEAGFVARSAAVSRSLDQQGIRSLSTQQALDALEYVLRHRAVQPCVMNIDWYTVRKLWGSFCRLGHLCQEVPTGAAEAAVHRNGQVFRQKLRAPDLGEAPRELLETHVREQVARVLGSAPAELDPQVPFNSLGLDSLMALELRNNLGASLELNLPATVFWAYPDIRALCHHLAGQLGIDGATQEDRALQPAAPADAALPSEQLLERLSDSELATLLDSEIAALTDLGEPMS
jgi:NADPH:quinone reductase-like Zn-dependent oxidoreductase/NADP-dependent 3-hydroxy acid dehydrogenase YdfG/SAM-dependent methyltransferase